MYVRNYCPNVTFACISHTERLWLANLGTHKRLVHKDEAGYYTKSPDGARLDIGIADILSCIPRGEYNELVKVLP